MKTLENLHNSFENILANNIVIMKEANLGGFEKGI